MPNEEQRAKPLPHGPRAITRCNRCYGFIPAKERLCERCKAIIVRERVAGLCMCIGGVLAVAPAFFVARLISRLCGEPRANQTLFVCIYLFMLVVCIVFVVRCSAYLNDE